MEQTKSTQGVFQTATEKSNQSDGPGPGWIKTMGAFCGSKIKGTPEGRKHLAQAAWVGEWLGRNKIRLVYGGGDAGLMGTVSAAAIAAGGEVWSANLECFSGQGEGLGGSAGVTVATMHERKAHFIEESDIFVLLSGGGLGSLDELYEILSHNDIAQRLRPNHPLIPIIIINIDGYWDEALATVDKTVKHGYTTDNGRLQHFMHVVESHEECFMLIEELNNKPAPMPSQLPPKHTGDGDIDYRALAQQMVSEGHSLPFLGPNEDAGNLDDKYDDQQEGSAPEPST
jgi:hypothetical protein